jgi:ribonuclease Z
MVAACVPAAAARSGVAPLRAATAQIMATGRPFTALPYDPPRLVDVLLPGNHRLLLVGESGAGKSTLAAKMADVLAERGRPCLCLSADPGSPAFGAPGAVNLAVRRAAGWQVVDLEAVCSLDAARFRLPLLMAVRRLLRRVPDGVLLIDAPGLVRGVAGAELIEGLLDETAAERVLVLARRDRPLPLVPTLRATAGRVQWLASPAQALDAGRSIRAQWRTTLWDAYLGAAATQSMALRRLPLKGVPPPQSDPAAWRGRQIGLLRGSRTIMLGEVLTLTDGSLELRLPHPVPRPDALVVRDAVRAEGLLVTARPAAPAPGPAPAAEEPGAGRRLGDFDVSLVNGVLGDPLLMARPRRERRGLLFDIGDAGRLSAGVLHTVSDIFVTHAHIDHIGGFLWLLRNRLGELTPCRLYGPPGLAGHLDGFLRGVLWDRIGDRGPVFEVTELHEDHGERYRLQAGQRAVQLGSETIADGRLLSEPGFRVRATALDHGFGTISLGYALETPVRFKARKDRLAALGLPPGPWLGELKRRALAGELDGTIETPDGRRWDSGALARDILLESPGVKLAYATDLADTADNRTRLSALAHGADLFFCEASFLVAEREQAARTGHLTTRACAEIAAAAGVRRLVPFHFSRRYQERLGEVYAELRSLHPAVAGPSAGQLEADHADDDDAEEGEPRRRQRIAEEQDADGGDADRAQAGPDGVGGADGDAAHRERQQRHVQHRQHRR